MICQSDLLILQCKMFFNYETKEYPLCLAVVQVKLGSVIKNYNFGC